MAGIKTDQKGAVSRKRFLIIAIAALNIFEENGASDET